MVLMLLKRCFLQIHVTLHCSSIFCKAKRSHLNYSKKKDILTKMRRRKKSNCIVSLARKFKLFLINEVSFTELIVKKLQTCQSPNYVIQLAF